MLLITTGLFLLWHIKKLDSFYFRVMPNIWPSHKTSLYIKHQNYNKTPSDNIYAEHIHTSYNIIYIYTFK